MVNLAKYLVIATVGMSTPALALATAPVKCACDRSAIASSEMRRPNWTGVWVRIGSLSDPRAKHDDREVPPSPTDESDWPALTDAYRDKYRIIAKALENGERLNDPTGNCLPAGFPWMMNMPYPMEIHQTAAQITLIAEWMSQTRRIYIGAEHSKDPDPTFFGDSVAHWQGNVLVVDTVGLRGDTTMNDSGLMHGEHTHVIERWSQPKSGLLDDELTVIDGEMLTRPWARIFHYRREPRFRVMEYVCENNRDFVPRAAIKSQ